MPADPELLTPAEAAVVASVNVRDVHRMIDEHILPKEFYTLAKGRRLRAMACPFVGFYVHEAKRLTKEERGALIHRVSGRMSADKARWSIRRWRRESKPDEWTVRDDNITVSLWSFVTSAGDRHDKLAEARAIVIEDPEILSGTPVIRGTRIPVYDIAASVAAGLPASRIKASYPGLDERTLELASLYAEATPPRGRPRQAALASATERKVVRRRRA
jgi:uncharacterized protein (DUF433 family)